MIPVNKTQCHTHVTQVRHRCSRKSRTGHHATRSPFLPAGLRFVSRFSDIPSYRQCRPPSLRNLIPRLRSGIRIPGHRCSEVDYNTVCLRRQQHQAPALTK